MFARTRRGRRGKMKENSHLTAAKAHRLRMKSPNMTSWRLFPTACAWPRRKASQGQAETWRRIPRALMGLLQWLQKPTLLSLSYEMTTNGRCHWRHGTLTDLRLFFSDVIADRLWGARWEKGAESGWVRLRTKPAEKKWTYSRWRRCLLCWRKQTGEKA